MDQTTLTTSVSRGAAGRGAAGRQYRRATRQCHQLTLVDLFRYWQAARDGRRAVDLSRRRSPGQRH
ncbi:hypothetical protein [Pseudonocardia lacus]|uniref:hypothetical protein n=1 Tax=Pseudonocardia lacus TaxID=2835865 RepID=UPI001BDD6985|nr:hypothetical protein [Pseudonocardia lacus]